VIARCRLFLLLLLCQPALAQQSDTAKARQELKSVQQDISRTEQQRKSQQQQLAEAEQQLKKADQQLAEAAAAVAVQQQELKLLNDKLQELQQRQQQLEAQRLEQQQLLAAQVKAAYQVGGHDYTQLLLNQQDALKLERLLTYYQYFNNARIRQLEALKQTYQQLSELTTAQQQAHHEQSLRLDELKSRQQDLQQAKSSQQQSIRNLQELLEAQKQQLAYLKSNEKSLQSTIAKLKAEAANRRLAYTGKKQGQLPWPVQGKIAQKFGAQQGGQTTASGILIQADNGQPVRAVADGQVIYADWLRGYGWVIVLDHGNGLMSLYGHNQSLLKSPGDVVRSGDHLALVGQSGGRDRSGLYFEIRQKGTAVDPLRWLRNP
jgi:septal ring factor EnvC (AmiA/AmiB activator)